MDEQKLKGIINYAIEREKEAVRFYHEMQSSVHFTERKKLLHDLENMEKGHIAILENVGRQKINDITVPDVQDLRISDYIVDEELSGEPTYEDILIMAMKREQTSYRLYHDLAEISAEYNVKKLFLKLASEEAKHKLLFEEMYDEEMLSQD
jgi:rubrerythrin